MFGLFEFVFKGFYLPVGILELVSNGFVLIVCVFGCLIVLAVLIHEVVSEDLIAEIWFFRLFPLCFALFVKFIFDVLCGFFVDDF